MNMKKIRRGCAGAKLFLTYRSLKVFDGGHCNHLRWARLVIWERYLYTIKKFTNSKEMQQMKIVASDKIRTPQSTE